MFSTPKTHAHPLQTYVATSPLSVSQLPSPQASTVGSGATDELELGYGWRAVDAVDAGDVAAPQGRGCIVALEACFGPRAARLPSLVGGLAGFVAPLTVGIANVVRAPSVFNPTGERNIGLAASVLLGGITLGPAIGLVVGALAGSVCCRAPLPWRQGP